MSETIDTETTEPVTDEGPDTESDAVARLFPGEHGGDDQPDVDSDVDAWWEDEDDPELYAAPGPDPNGWAGPTEEQWHQTRAAVYELAQRAQQQPQADLEPAGFELDPLDDLFPAQLEQVLAARDQHLLNHVMGQLAPVLGPVIAQQEQAQYDEAEAIATSVFEAEAQAGGEFDRSIARDLAEAGYMRLARDYPNANPAELAVYALREAADRAREVSAPTPAPRRSAAKTRTRVLPEAETEHEAVKRAFGIEG